jgi:type II secretory pathway pseudopilin PulG
MKKKNAFTLVEILIVFTIVILLALMMVSIFASKNFFDKGKDSQRKKDLARIKVAFEEYYNDKNCYPQDVANWNIQENCKRSSLISFPYLSPWPCDPNGEPYLIIVDSCNKFRVITNLENKNDEDIPPLWHTRTDVILNGKTVEEVNYGVSSARSKLLLFFLF